jgi:hypothetical protein
VEIRVYDRELAYKGSLENQTSLIWRRKYYEAGDFEIHAPITPKNLELLKAGNIITKRGSVEAGVIGDVENEESDIKNEVTRKGKFLSSYFDRRLIKSTVNFSGKIEVAMRQLVNEVIPIPRVQLGELQGFPETAEFQVTMKQLDSFLTKLAKSGTLGFRLRPDFRQKALYFEVYKGTDRTISQGINSRVIFSEGYENLNNAIYRYNDQLQKTCAIVGGEGEGAARVFITVGGGTGLDLREVFVDARDARSEGLTTEQYTAVLRQRGLEMLAESIAYESIECETNADINFKYLEDYDLGDVVSIKKRSWDIAFNQRITELTEVYQYGNMFVVPTFGDPMPEKLVMEE